MSMTMRCENLRAQQLYSYTLQGCATSPWIVEDTNRAYRYRRRAIRTAIPVRPRRAQTDRRTSIAVTAGRDRRQWTPGPACQRVVVIPSRARGSVSANLKGVGYEMA